MGARTSAAQFAGDTSPSPNRFDFEFGYYYHLQEDYQTLPKEDSQAGVAKKRRCGLESGTRILDPSSDDAASQPLKHHDVQHGPVRFSMVPLIGTGACYYARTREPNLLEAVLRRDVGALAKVVELHNNLLDGTVSSFRNAVVEAIEATFSGCKVVEAGSSGRGTCIFPLSDVDLVCLFDADFLAGDIRAKIFQLRQKLKTAIHERFPEWQVQQRVYSVQICAEPDAEAAHLFGNDLYADVLFGIKGNPQRLGIHSASHAEGRRNILAKLPAEVRQAAQILKVIMKSHSWPDIRSKPPSYLVDVIVKYLWERGCPRLCKSEKKDPRPYITTSAECYMFWQASCLASGQQCTQCQCPIWQGFWKCFACDVALCSRSCLHLRKEWKKEHQKILRARMPFPDCAYHFFSTVPASRHAEHNNQQWIDPGPPQEPLLKSDVVHLVFGFFRFCAYFDHAAIFFKERALDSSNVTCPYVEDPGCLGNNVVQSFNFRPLMQMCWDSIDDSSCGFHDLHQFGQLRHELFRPFTKVLSPGTKVTVFIIAIEYEQMFECQVDPRWSFNRLWEMHKILASKKFDVPNVLFWDKHRALFMTQGGVIARWEKPMISEGVTFGSTIYLLDRSSFRLATSQDTLHQQELRVEAVDDSVEPASIRQPNFVWNGPSGSHDKTFVDLRNGECCFFSGSLNKCRALGPDFDCRPDNFPDGVAASESSPSLVDQLRAQGGHVMPPMRVYR